MKDSFKKETKERIAWLEKLKGLVKKKEIPFIKGRIHQLKDQKRKRCVGGEMFLWEVK